MAELAHYLAAPEAVLGDPKLLYYSILAGERALACYVGGLKADLKERNRSASADGTGQYH